VSDRDQESDPKRVLRTLGKKPNQAPARVALGMAGLLAQSETVSKAFGPRLGFALMVLAILAGSSVVATTIIILAKWIGRFL
jgi:hypothetical protein